MQLFVRPLDLPTIVIEVESSDTIDKVKEMIEKRTKIPRSYQHLITGSQCLYNGKTLEQYHIDQGITLNVVFRLLSSNMNT